MEYGPIGMIFALMAYLIAIGVVVILGAVTGLIWQDRGLSFTAGWVRSLTFPLGFLTLGLGFLGILVQRKHRALYDLIAGTAVVYAWDARAARLRFLARQAEPIADAAQGPGTTKPAAVTADRPVPVDQTGSTADLLADAFRSAGAVGPLKDMFGVMAGFAGYVSFFWGIRRVTSTGSTRRGAR
jgi:hypothetical protein